MAQFIVEKLEEGVSIQCICGRPYWYNYVHYIIISILAVHAHTLYMYLLLGGTQCMLLILCLNCHRLLHDFPQHFHTIIKNSWLCILYCILYILYI